MPQIARRPFFALAAGLLAAPALARASTWPDRPIRLIVPVAPGGSQDIVARHSARALTDILGQPVQVENLAGGGSNIGYAAAARAAADGNTLLAGADTLSITGSLTPRLGFDPLDFAAIHRTVRVPQILVVRADDPAPDFATWFAASRRRPPAIGTPGHGQLAHLLVEQLSRASGTAWTHVPYRGGALALNDLMGGQLQGVMINIGAVTDHVRGGRLKALMVSPEARAAALPDVPTLGELGFGDLTAVGWHGLLAPAGTDPAILTRLNAASREAVKRPDVAARLAALGVEATDEAPEVLQAAIREDAARYAEIIRRFGISAA
ncbi:Bug family tripartite tricarboxylate transporter substrate binding protein [Falsiroseomonas tokyonensis]|uniref:Bug family tripartite tricarboxylate transporter substrate binding protein n=1 Tax=Falsiroseomonas tokyonensis TaxID=430521 RepID=A0ABV7C0G9_9PROT|nr:tripartite tricarboxylate transporter substrate binding protein [Falsiroseomonas tokyonensis]MBU8541304.1 tripartite tricarboxylate transporter substrate binding protein [Falsiroseomonas tokyonensis]